MGTYYRGIGDLGGNYIAIHDVLYYIIITITMFFICYRLFNRLNTLLRDSKYKNIIMWSTRWFFHITKSRGKQKNESYYREIR